MGHDPDQLRVAHHRELTDAVPYQQSLGVTHGATGVDGDHRSAHSVAYEHHVIDHLARRFGKYVKSSSRFDENCLIRAGIQS